ncbi:MAG: hypothetical protein ACR2IK_18395 [Chloroflexota bacterium]
MTIDSTGVSAEEIVSVISAVLDRENHADGSAALILAAFAIVIGRCAVLQDPWGTARWR